MKIRILIAAILILSFMADPALPMSKEKAEYRMNDILGKAYKAASENKPKNSRKLFGEAKPYAMSSESWRGLVDIANAYAVLGDVNEAIPLLRVAGKISSENDDWRGLLAVGYSFLELPGTKNHKKYARDYFVKAYDISAKNSSSRALNETAIAFLTLGDKEMAKDLSDRALAIGKINKDVTSLIRTAKVYQRLRLIPQADQVKASVKEYRTSPDERDAATKHKELNEKNYYKEFWTYYNPPFTTPDPVEWGSFHLRYYRSNGENYIYRGL